VEHHGEEKLGMLGDNLESVLLEGAPDLARRENGVWPGISLDPPLESEELVRHHIHTPNRRILYDHRILRDSA
jgi:hypothetical protein